MLPKYEESVEAIEKAIRRAPPMQSFSDPSGTFLADNLDPGVYVVTIRATGHAEAITRNVQVPSGTTGNLGTIVMENGATLKGTITDQSGSNVRDAVVTLTRRVETSDPNLQRTMMKLASAKSGGDDTSDGAGGALPQVIWNGYPTADGTYAVTGLTAGSYTVEIRSARHVVPESFQLTIQRNATHIHNFELNLASTITMSLKDEVGDPVPAVSARILDVSTSRPPFGVRPPSSDAQGMINIGNLAAGTYNVILTRTGFIVHEEPVVIEAGASARRDIVLQRIR
jgi:hypothetical protein